MPTKKRTIPEDRETEAYCWRWGLDAATAARHKVLRSVLNECGYVPPPEKLADLLRGRGVVVTPDTVARDLQFFASAYLEQKAETGLLDDADEPNPIPPG